MSVDSVKERNHNPDASERIEIDLDSLFSSGICWTEQEETENGFRTYGCSRITNWRTGEVKETRESYGRELVWDKPKKKRWWNV